ncbi:Ig-like domain-containing protein [Roseivirga sp. BDSF3-8]|uniref:Ig-like domain-containing protein n=1 Tax=Roseivirga sp. BDSF3-8 TaxID=3241598 RepID=UPI003531A563
MLHKPIVWGFFLLLLSTIFTCVPFIAFSQISGNDIRVHQVACPPTRSTPLALDDVYIIETEEEARFCPVSNDYLPDAKTPSFTILEISRSNERDDPDDGRHMGENDDEEDKDEDNAETEIIREGICLNVKSGTKANERLFIRYRICTDGGNCSEATALIFVRKVRNRQIWTASEQVLTSPQKSVVIPVLTNDRPRLFSTHVNIKAVQNGTAEVRNNDILFNPAEGFSGLAKIQYEVCQIIDNKRSCRPAFAYVHVCDLSPAPIAKNDNYTVQAGDILEVVAPGVLDNDLLNGSTGVRTRLTRYASKGTLQFRANGSFTYSPDQEARGEDSFAYELLNDQGTSDVAEVTINLLEPETPFQTSPDYYSLTEGGRLSVTPEEGVMKNDRVDNRQETTVILGQATKFGTLILAQDGSFQYTHNGSEERKDSFTYRLATEGKHSGHETVHLQIENVNDPPVAVPDTYQIPGDGLNLSVDAQMGVLANDRDIEGNNLVAILVDQPLNGRVQMEASGAFTFQGNSAVTTTQTFTYRAFDGMNYSQKVAVILSPGINSPLIAMDDQYEVTAGNTLTITKEQGLLANDTVGEKVPRIEITRQPIFGNLTLNSDGSFRYTTTSDLAGTELFTYRLTDQGRQSNDAIVAITITPENRPPIVENEGPLSLQAGQAISLNVLENDVDPEAASLYVADLTLTDPSAGSITWNDRGDFTFAPHYLFSGRVEAVYTVSDGHNEVQGSVIIDVFPPETMSLTVRSGDEVNLCQSLSLGAQNGIYVNHIYIEPRAGKLEETDACAVYYPQNREHDILMDEILLSICEQGDNCKTLAVELEIVPELKVYGGFSPNSDSYNETWQISGIQWYQENKVSVYNNEGDLVFQGVNYDNSEVVWQGHGNYGQYSGQPLPEGSYSYVIHLNGHKSRSGSVILAR